MFKQAGASLKVPSIWVYGRRDLNYSDDSIVGYVEKFRQAGGDISFNFYDHDLKDGHAVLVLWKQWVPDMNRFFQRLGYPYLGKR